MIERAVSKKAASGKKAPARRKSGGVRSLALGDGGRVRIARGSGGEALQVVSASGDVRLEVLLTPEGAVLRIAGSRVAIEAEGELALRCARFAVEAETIALGASGDVTLEAGRGLGLRAGHDAELSSQAVKLEARRGDVSIVANDDVALNGERVLLNCPTDEEAERQRQAAKSMKDLLELPFQAPGSPRRLRASSPVDEAEP